MLTAMSVGFRVNQLEIAFTSSSEKETMSKYTENNWVWWPCFSSICWGSICILYVFHITSITSLGSYILIMVHVVCVLVYQYCSEDSCRSKPAYPKKSAQDTQTRMSIKGSWTSNLNIHMVRDRWSRASEWLETPFYQTHQFLSQQPDNRSCRTLLHDQSPTNALYTLAGYSWKTPSRL